MTPKERLFARLAGQPVDRVPNLNIVMLFAAKYTGIPYGKFCSDYHALVEAQTKTAKDFGIDILSTMSDPFRETHDFGAPIRIREDDLPICERNILTGPADLPNLKDFDPLGGGRMTDRIRAIELFKTQNGEEFPILGWIEGPWAEFTDLTSIEAGMIMQFDDPEFVQEAMEFISKKEIECACAQVDAGADIIGMGDAAASLVNTETYENLIFPLEKKIISAIHEHGGKVKLHICGNINHLMPVMVNTGADIIDIDYMVDFEKSLQLAMGKCSISGNLNPVGLIMQGTPEKIAAETKNILNFPSATSIISSGCEIPKDTPLENIKVISDVVKKTEVSIQPVVEKIVVENTQSVVSERKEEVNGILDEISINLQKGKAKIVKGLVQQAIDEGLPAKQILEDGLMAGMAIIGEKFKNNEVFVPEVLVAARAMNRGAALLKPILSENGVQATGKVCIGTVKGDLHDIGKNLVKMMLESKGLEVVDLGTDVSPAQFIDAVKNEGCQIICCSALLTTTMNTMGEVVEAAKVAGIRDQVKIMIGGAPVTEEFCQKIGADCYTPDAATAAEQAVRLLAS